MSGEAYTAIAYHIKLKNHRSIRTILPIVLLTVLLGSAPMQANAQELIANIDLAGGELSRNEARLFFTMRLQHWSDDQPLQVFVLPDDDPVHGLFAKTVLGLFPYQLRRIWDRQLFSGTGQVPIMVSNEAEMVQRIASTPGAIGYVERAPLDARIQTIRVY